MSLQTYKETIVDDVIAGVSVAALFIPQSMAYAVLAGVNPVIGLYSGIIPMIVYALFGTSRHLSVGPISIVSLLTFSTVAHLAQPESAYYLAYVILLTFMVGGILVLCSFLPLGKVVHRIPNNVIKGFVSAIAILIILNQLKYVMGIHLSKHNYTHELIMEILSKVIKIDSYSVVIAGMSLMFLLWLKKISPRIPAAIFVVIISTILVKSFGLHTKGLLIIGVIPSGLPGMTWPIMNYEMVRTLFPSALAISFIVLMESYTIGKTIAVKDGYKININKEMKSLGLANVMGSFFSSMPVSGAFSRTAVNFDVGAKSKLSGLVTSLLVILSLTYLTPLFYYLPYAALAAIIISAVLGLINLQMATGKYEKLVLYVTFASTLFLDVLLGLMFGIILSILKAVPRVNVK